jgi:hypothetical protein
MRAMRSNPWAGGPGGAPFPSATPAAPEGVRRYLLAGLLTCGTCGRRMESV